MADIVVGRTLNRIRIKLVRSSQEAFALAWRDANGDPLDITAYTFSIVVDIPEAASVTWTATKAGSQTTWSLNATQTNLPIGYYSGRLVATDSNGPLVAYSVVVEVQ